MSLGQLLVQTCSIHRWSPRSVGADGTLDAGGYQQLVTGVPCNVQEKTGRVKKTVAGQVVEFSAVGFFQPETDLRARASGGNHEDLIVMDSGARYTVKGVTDETGRGFMLTVYLEKSDAAA